MLSLESFWSRHHRVWVTDYKADTKSLQAGEVVYWLPYQGPRKIWPFLRNIPSTFRIISHEKPDLVLSTGASIALNFAWVSKLLGIRFMYIESPSRLSKLSLSGMLVYPVSSEFYVQSKKLAKKYARAIFAGFI